MPQDAFTLLHTAKELNNKLLGARVDKINQPDNDTIFLQIRVGNENTKLTISANAQTNRICTTAQERNNPLVAPNFCMLLRKHLTHSTIKQIELVNLERIVKITFICKNEMRESNEKQLYAEIMGKFSNIILVENQIILGALKPSTLDISNLRPIFPGLKYTLPISQNKVEIFNEEQSIKMLNSFSCGELSTFLFNNFKGLSKQTAEEIVYSYKLTLSQTCDIVKNFKSQDFFEFFRNFYVSPKINPNITQNDFFICDYKSIELSKRYFESIDSAVDIYFSTKEFDKQFATKKSKLTSAVSACEKKLNKKLQIILEKELSCANLELNKLYGELILANLWQYKSPTDKITVIDYSKEDCPEITIKLDKTISVKENADKFFKKYAKQKKTLTAIAPQKVEILELLNYTSTLFREIEMAENMLDFADIEEELATIGIIKQQNDKKIKQEVSKPRSYNYLGFEILVGRNNLQNDKLTLSAERNDIFVHVKDYHSAHTIIKAKNSVVPDEVIVFASEICAFFSQAKNSEKVPVDYTLRKFVKKPHGAKCGMVFYTNQKTILVTPNQHI